jgi:hypothetical protein
MIPWLSPGNFAVFSDTLYLLFQIGRVLKNIENKSWFLWIVIVNVTLYETKKERPQAVSF